MGCQRLPTPPPLPGFHRSLPALGRNPGEDAAGGCGVVYKEERLDSAGNRTGEFYAVKYQSRRELEAGGGARAAVAGRELVNQLLAGHATVAVFVRAELLADTINPGEARGWLVTVSEFCSHGNLLAWLKSQPGWKASEALARHAIVQVVEAVQHLHRNDLVHRDLKLDNICVMPPAGATVGQTLNLAGVAPVIKLIDFGASRSVTNGSLVQSRAGTYHFMAPEVRCGCKVCCNAL